MWQNSNTVQDKSLKYNKIPGCTDANKSQQSLKKNPGLTSSQTKYMKFKKIPGHTLNQKNRYNVPVLL